MLKKDINNGFLRVSQLVESEQEALNRIVEFDLQEFEKRAYKNEVHRLQYLTSRILLREIFESDLGLGYYGLSNVDGVPSDIDGYVISVSHSDELVVVGVSKNKIGVDIQKANGKVSKVIGRVCNEEEIKLGGDVVKEIVLWSVKESYYKRQKKAGVDFKKHLFVDEFEIIGSEIKGVGRVFVNGGLEIVKFEGGIIKDYVFIYTV